MSTELATSSQSTEVAAAAVENVLLHGDIGKLTAPQRIAYYNRVCESIGLNPLTQPFAFVSMNGKVVFYALKSATEQLRSNRGISIQIVSREISEGSYVVVAKAIDPQGRYDESIGAVPIESKKGEDRSNAMMKAETKAKRRVTLSICGLGMLDESEIDSVAGAEVVKPFNAHPLLGKPKNYAETSDPVTGEVVPIRQSKKRTGLLAQAHIIKTNLKITDEIWRGRLQQMFGVDSSAKLSDEQLATLVKALEATAQKDAEARAGASQMAAMETAEPMMSQAQQGLILSAINTLGLEIVEVLGWYEHKYWTEMTETEAAEAINRLTNLMQGQSTKEDSK